MNLFRVNAFQAIELPTNPKSNYNSISVDVIPGVELTLVDQVVHVTHQEWNTIVIVALTNVRSMVALKPRSAPVNIMTEAEVKKKRVRK
jgi:hypothetical protein